MTMKDYENKLKHATGGLLKTGVGLMAGHAVVGTLANVPGMPAQGKATAGVVGTGLNLLAVGQLAKTAYNIMPVGTSVTKKKTGSGPVDKILGY